MKLLGGFLVSSALMIGITIGAANARISEHPVRDCQPMVEFLAGVIYNKREHGETVDKSLKRVEALEVTDASKAVLRSHVTQIYTEWDDYKDITELGPWSAWLTQRCMASEGRAVVLGDES